MELAPAPVSVVDADWVSQVALRVPPEVEQLEVLAVAWAVAVVVAVVEGAPVGFLDDDDGAAVVVVELAAVLVEVVALVVVVVVWCLAAVGVELHAPATSAAALRAATGTTTPRRRRRRGSPGSPPLRLSLCSVTRLLPPPGRTPGPLPSSIKTNPTELLKIVGLGPAVHRAGGPGPPAAVVGGRVGGQAPIPCLVRAPRRAGSGPGAVPAPRRAASGPGGQNPRVHIPAKVDYGMRALLSLTERGEPATAEELADDQGLPARFLGAILIELRRAGLVASQRGAEGGYRLARPAKEISVADVMRALDGPLAEVRGLRPEAASYDGAAVHLQDVWVAVRASLRNVLERVSLDDVVAGRLPRPVARLTEDPDAWAPR